MNKASVWFAAVGVGSLSAAGLALAAPPASALDGWGGLRFGMTVDEARAVVGYKWSEPEKVDVHTGPGTIAIWTTLKPADQVQFAGQPFNLQANFDANGRLSNIKLTNERSVASFEGCDAEFRKLLTEGERQFGVFQPVQLAHAETRDIDMEKQTGTADWLVLIEHRRAPGGKSTYEYLMTKWRKASQSAWHVYKLDNAVRPFNASYVELMVALDPKKPCELTVGFGSGAYPFKK